MTMQTVHDTLASLSMRFVWYVKVMNSRTFYMYITFNVRALSN